MNTLRDVIVAKQRSSQDTEPKIIYVSGIQVGVDYPNDASVKNRDGYVWVRENGQDSGVFQCYSPIVRTMANLPVIVSHNPTKPVRRMVINVDWDKLSIADQGRIYSIPRHANTHEWPTMNPGDDVVHVYPRAIIPLGVYPAYPNLAFSVGHSRYVYNGIIQEFPGLLSWDLTDSLPVTIDFYRVCLAYLNPRTNGIEVLDGEESASPTPPYPSTPKEVIPLVYIRLVYGQTSLHEADIIEDARPLYTIMEEMGDVFSDINNRMALLEAEFDFVMTRHVVSGG